jgi:hypothetical protein
MRFSPFNLLPASGLRAFPGPFGRQRGAAKRAKKDLAVREKAPYLCSPLKRGVCLKQGIAWPIRMLVFRGGKKNREIFLAG